MASFPTACQSSDLRADRSTEACGLTCAPCGSPGANCCCNRSAMAGSRASAGSTPASTPRTTARNSRSVTDEHRPVVRFSDDLGGRQPGWQVPFGFRIPEGVKINKETYETIPHLSRRWSRGLRIPTETVTGHSSRTGRTGGVPATPRVNQKRCKKMSFLHPQGPVAPIIDRSETYGLHDVVCAWERSLLQAAQENMISEWQKIPETVVRAAIWDFTEGLLPLCRLAAATLINYLICC